MTFHTYLIISENKLEYTIHTISLYEMEQEQEQDKKHYFVYLLVSTNGNTYVGATVDLHRRLRQHNKEITGGAIATGIKVSRGETWERAVHVSGFPDWSSALQFEWKWKYLTRTLIKTKTTTTTNPLERRMNALKTLVQSTQSTSKAAPFSSWPTPLQVYLECHQVQIYKDWFIAFLPISHS